MIGMLFRLIVLVAVAGAAAIYFGWKPGSLSLPGSATVGSSPIDSERAREAGANIAGKVAAGASRAEQALAETGLTAKITAKMKLDDTIDVGEVDVTTKGTVVTLSGSVANRAQRQRVLQLARETSGVTSVVDKLETRGK